MITAEQVREIFDYYPASGEFKWKRHPVNSNNNGFPAGKLDSAGRYLRIFVLGNRYPASRLAWLYVYGVWPSKKIDHINGNGQDNRIENLRDVSQSENMQNIRISKSKRKDGLMGVSHYPARKRKQWTAQIRVDGTNRHLGSYWTGEEAFSAYVEAKRQFHPFSCI